MAFMGGFALVMRCMFVIRYLSVVGTRPLLVLVRCQEPSVDRNRPLTGTVRWQVPVRCQPGIKEKAPAVFFRSTSRGFKCPKNGAILCGAKMSSAVGCWLLTSRCCGWQDANKRRRTFLHVGTCPLPGTIRCQVSSIGIVLLYLVSLALRVVLSEV